MWICRYMTWFTDRISKYWHKSKIFIISNWFLSVYIRINDKKSHLRLWLDKREFWWRWRDSNPRPKRLHLRHYMFRQSLISIPAADSHATKYQACKGFNASTTGRASTRSSEEPTPVLPSVTRKTWHRGLRAGY